MSRMQEKEGSTESKELKERSIQNRILDILNRNEIFSWENDTTGKVKDGRFIKRTGFAIRGGSDILGILPGSGKMLAIEVKRNKSEMNRTDDRTKRQKAFIAKINKSTGVAFMCYSVETFLNEMKERGIIINELDE